MGSAEPTFAVAKAPASCVKGVLLSNCKRKSKRSLLAVYVPSRASVRNYSLDRPIEQDLFGKAPTPRGRLVDYDGSMDCRL